MTYCLTDSAGKEYFVQAERREDAERFAYVRGLCFTGRTAPRRYKLYAEPARPREGRARSWWTQRDADGNCFEIRDSWKDGKKRFALFVNDIFRSVYSEFSEAENQIKTMWKE